MLVALYPGFNYAGEGKRDWYLPFAVVLDFPGISGNSILPLTMTQSLGVATYII